MRPRTFNNEADALRWSRCGGVALVIPAEPSGRCALFASAQSSDSAGWSRYYAGHAGATFITVENRGRWNESITLEPEQARQVARQGYDGPRSNGSLLTTVVFFTGTREGMTNEQREAVREILFARDVFSAHHGMCVGADHQFHEIVFGMRAPIEGGGVRPLVVGWPGDVPRDLTVLGKVTCDTVKVKRPPLLRNKEMAAHAAYFEKLRREKGSGGEVVCVACPLEHEPPANGRGGTWHAIRQFRSAGIAVLVVLPNGSVSP